MREIRFHGRGGQGAVTAAELLAVAAINEGKYGQSFPSFGPERRGAPVTAFVRISDEPILVRSPITDPDIVVVLDSKLVPSINPKIVVINTQNPDKIRLKFKQSKVATLDATGIAKEVLGVAIPNTTMLGALVKATNLIKLTSLEGPLRERFGRLAEKNIAAVNEAYQRVLIK